MRQRQSLSFSSSSFSSSSSAFSTSAHGTGQQTAQGVRDDARDAVDGSHDGPVKEARSERSRQKPATVAPPSSAKRAPTKSASTPSSDLGDLAFDNLSFDKHSVSGVVAIQPLPPQIQIQPFASVAAFARSIEQRVHLPETFEGFIIYCAGLMLVVLGMTLHISLSAEILQAEVRVHELQFEYERLGQQNSELIWQIARESSLERLQHRVAGLGYAPITEREYVPVVVEGAPVASSASAVAASTVVASAENASPRLNLMEQLRAYFGGARDSALPSGPPASVRYVGPESGEAGATTSAPAEWWGKVWSDTLERGEKSLEWITGIESVD